MAERHTQLAISVSHTTRAPRDTEREGRDYFFVDRHRFLEMVTNGEFLEHAEVFNHLYGQKIHSKRHIFISLCSW